VALKPGALAGASFVVLAAVLAGLGQSNSPQGDPPALQSEVDKLFAPSGRKDSPGCALAILKNGTVLYKRGYGMADLEHSIPVSTDTVFQIASTSKQFTAMAVILLAQDGKLSLDDAVRQYIPELPDYGHPITIRHLLNHTSGLRNLFVLYQLAGWRWGDIVNERNELDLISRQRGLNFNPGDEHAYTNTGYFLLAEIVKRVSHQSFGDFARARIFEPLAMKNTLVLDDNRLLIPNRARAYNSEPTGFTNNTTLTETVGDSNVYTTVEDMARWDENFYTGRVGGLSGIAEMEKPGVLNSGEPLQNGAGLNITSYKGLRMIWHSGASSYKSEYLRFPDQHFSVMCLCNSWSPDPSDLARKIADLYLADLVHVERAKSPSAAAEEIAALEKSARAEAIPLSAEKMKALTGSYLTPEAAAVRRVFLDGARLMVERGRGVLSELVPIGERHFLMLGVPDRVEVTFSGEPEVAKQVWLAAKGRKPVGLERVEPAIATDLKQYEGDFWSSDVGETVTMVAHDGKLCLQTKRNVEFELQPVAADIFKNQWFGRITFRRNQRRSVTAFTVSNGEVRSLELTKVKVRFEPMD
jgi:CubicO group peptidase (beta-lactamase class C family)